MSENRRLKVARVSEGLTQFQLAELIGLREVDISRFETGRGSPAPTVRQRLAAVLKRPAFELFDS